MHTIPLICYCLILPLDIWFAFYNPDPSTAHNATHCGTIWHSLYCQPMDPPYRENMSDITAGYKKFFYFGVFIDVWNIARCLLFVKMMDKAAMLMWEISLFYSTVWFFWGPIRRFEEEGRTAAGDFMTEDDDPALYLVYSGIYLKIWVIVVVVLFCSLVFAFIVWLTSF